MKRLTGTLLVLLSLLVTWCHAILPRYGNQAWRSHVRRALKDESSASVSVPTGQYFESTPRPIPTPLQYPNTPEASSVTNVPSSVSVSRSEGQPSGRDSSITGGSQPNSSSSNTVSHSSPVQSPATNTPGDLSDTIPPPSSSAAPSQNSMSSGTSHSTNNAPPIHTPQSPSGSIHSPPPPSYPTIIPSVTATLEKSNTDTVGDTPISPSSSNKEDTQSSPPSYPNPQKSGTDSVSDMPSSSSGRSSEHTQSPPPRNSNTSSSATHTETPPIYSPPSASQVPPISSTKSGDNGTPSSQSDDKPKSTHSPPPASTSTSSSATSTETPPSYSSPSTNDTPPRSSTKTGGNGPYNSQSPDSTPSPSSKSQTATITRNLHTNTPPSSVLPGSSITSEASFPRESLSSNTSITVSDSRSDTDTKVVPTRPPPSSSDTADSSMVSSSDSSLQSSSPEKSITSDDSASLTATGTLSPTAIHSRPSSTLSPPVSHSAKPSQTATHSGQQITGTLAPITTPVPRVTSVSDGFIMPCSLPEAGLNYCFTVEGCTISAWKVQLTPGTYPAGPPPLTLASQISGVGLETKGRLPYWPECTVGKDHIPTFKTGVQCKTATAELCATISSYSIHASSTVAAQAILSTCSPLYGCEPKTYQPTQPSPPPPLSTETETQTNTDTETGNGCPARPTPAPCGAESPAGCGPKTKEYVIYPKNGTDTEACKRTLGSLKHSIANHEVISESTAKSFGVNFWRARLTEGEATKIQEDPGVASLYLACKDDCPNALIETVYQDVTKKYQTDKKPEQAKHLSFLSWPYQKLGNHSTENKYYFDHSSGEGVNVYVVDTGANLGHPELEYLKQGSPKWASTGSNDEPSPQDDSSGTGHGTSVLSLVMGKTLGVVRHANPVIVRMPSGKFSPEDYIEGLGKVNDLLSEKQDQARLQNPGAASSVVLLAQFFPHDWFKNNSAGWVNQHKLHLQRMIQHGAVIVTGTSNATHPKSNGWPANFGKPGPDHIEGVIVAGSVSVDGKQLAGGHDEAKGVPHVYAPGIDVVVADGTKGNNTEQRQYRIMEGTSCASALTAGLAAYYVKLAQLGMGRLPKTATPKDIKDHIISTAWSRADAAYGDEDKKARPAISNNITVAPAACEWQHFDPKAKDKMKCPSILPPSPSPPSSPVHSSPPSPSGPLVKSSSPSSPSPPAYSMPPHSSGLPSSPSPPVYSNTPSSPSPPAYSSPSSPPTLPSSSSLPGYSYSSPSSSQKPPSSPIPPAYSNPQLPSSESIIPSTSILPATPPHYTQEAPPSYLRI